MRTDCKALMKPLRKMSRPSLQNIFSLDGKPLFDFDIEQIKGESHSLPYFLTRTFFFEREPAESTWYLAKEQRINGL